jgi:DNA-binding NtrC family response regulator
MSGAEGPVVLRRAETVLGCGEKGVGLSVNVASAIPSARFSALLLEGEKGLGLESTLREHGCTVRRVTSRGAAQEALDGNDVVVISANGMSDEDVLDLAGRAVTAATVIVATDNTQVAVKAAKLGASTISGAALELAAAQIGQLLSVVELKKKVARHSVPISLSSPTSGVVSRRSTPLPKEATPDALEALIEAAEALVPMHRFQRVYVDYALRRFGGNKVHTAAALGIDRRTIQRWARARAEMQQQPATHATTS